MIVENCVKTDNERNLQLLYIEYWNMKSCHCLKFYVKLLNLLRFLATITYLFAFDTKLLMITWGRMLQKYLKYLKKNNHVRCIRANITHTGILNVCKLINGWRIFINCWLKLITSMIWWIMLIDGGVKTISENCIIWDHTKVEFDSFYSPFKIILNS